MKTQEQMWREAERNAAEANKVFLIMVNHPTAPLTRNELTELIHKHPERWARFGAWLEVLS